MNEEEYPYYISHIVRCTNTPIKRVDGKEVNNVFLQIISAHSTSRQSICWVENDKKTFFNSLNLDDTKRIVKVILATYVRFNFEILTLDRAYDEEMSLLMVKGFLNGDQNLQEKIDTYKLNKELE